MPNWFTKIFAREETPSEPDRKVSTPITSWRDVVRYYGLSENGTLSIATAYRCTQLLADTIASLHMQYMKKKDGRFVEDENSDIHYLLSVEPQPEMSIYSFWHAAVRQMLLLGNAYIFPRVIMGEITDFVLCSPRSVSHDALNGLYHITDPYNGICGTFTEDKVIHIFLHSPDGRIGESVMGHARRVLEIADTGDSETASQFVNGGVVRGIITNDKSITSWGSVQDDELEKRADITDDWFRNGRRIISLPNEADFKQISLSSADMQFLDTRKFTVREICRFFGVHPSFVFDDTSNNYKSAEMANVAFLSNTIDPILKRIEAEFNRKIIPRSMANKRMFLFDRKGIYTLDLGAKADYQKKTIEAGIYSINDWRRFENQPEVEGGDTIYISTNLAALGSEKLSGKTNINTNDDE